ncbi:hypothetical protein HKX48_005065 [Thoreauomyces humboldtii]|nr:hypothetical protein HKX48_005065 [Thoreauomyces humboldtii]
MGCRPSKSGLQASLEAEQSPHDAAPQQLSNTVTPSNGTTDDDPSWPFITRRDHVLYEGNKPYRFLSFNIPSLLLLEDRPDTDGWVSPDPFEQRDALLSIQHLGGRVTRSYTLGIGENYHITGPRNYNERCFVAMDHALAIAREVRVRIIVPFLNNHWGGQDGGTSDPSVCTFGNYAQMAKFRGKRPALFWSDPEIIDDFKHLISHVLNRVNTVNGIRYGDDPTVMAWQLGNELGGWSGGDPPAQWTLAMCAHLRSLAPRTLVMDGSIGGLKSKEKLSKDALASPLGPDVFVNHYYHGSEDVARLKKDADHIAGKHRKAFMVGEFGFAGPNVYGRMYDAIIRNDLVSGCLMWSLRYRSMFGGFYVHSEEGGKFWSYHNPGFRIDSHGFGTEEAEVIPQIRHYALSIQGLDPRAVEWPTPTPAPQLLPDACPNWIRFRGSTSAASYLVWRGVQGPDGQVTWDEQPVGTDVKDSICSGSTLWQDKSAKPGVGYFYAVQAVGVGGAMSARGEPVGPVWAPNDWGQ